MSDIELEKLKKNYFKFQYEIKECIMERDIDNFLDDLAELYIQDINTSQSDKKKNFLEWLDEPTDLTKYSYLKNSAKSHNNWIYEFLTVDIDNLAKYSELKAKWIVLDKTNSLIKKLKNTFVFDKNFVRSLFSKEIISKPDRDYLLNQIKENSESALFELFNVISLRDSNWFGNLLYIIAKQNSDFMYVLCDDLGPIGEFTTAKKKERCMDYANNFIEKHVQQYLQEIPNDNTDNDETASGYVSGDSGISELVDPENPDDEISLNYNVDRSKVRILQFENKVSLKLHSFQVELAEKALSGENVIIYAPTGSGKTIIAIHIANEHLAKNPDNKIAFLVHRTVLVTQQYRLFQKYKNLSTDVINIRGKSEKTIAPLIVQMKSYQIFIMTSDILLNALTFDDEHKINSITQFSLIFFDECHNCMGSHPYTKIMNEYFKEKRKNPKQPLPQIVGLTASPRSKNKLDNKGMKNALFELCGNLDCCHISMVKENEEDLRVLLAQPETTDCLTKNRETDDFEKVLLSMIELCESKYTKMKKEKYFTVKKLLPTPVDKYSQNYINFVGNLESLNTVTIDDNDGKQKAYCIYRYLNALYRSLIVNQLFNQEYARQKFQTYLKCNSSYFSCCYDIEFYNFYKDNILHKEFGQSDNPAIEEILWLVNDQLKSNAESRILIFVRERDFTEYLVNILMDKLNITAESIVGSSAKPDSGIFNKLDDILERFTNGTTKVLVSTSVTEEGTDIPLCNMVISYGVVTNETALVQRSGRLRIIGSKYVLVLPPMLSWLQEKEKTNKWRKNVMKELIKDLKSYDAVKIKEMNKIHQDKYFSVEKKVECKTPSENQWTFTCKNCQAFVCSSNDLRILEKAHRVCINPELLKKCTVVTEEIQVFGNSGSYEKAGDIFCWQCGNQKIGTYIKYKKVDYFQIKLDKCNATNARNQIRNFNKWAELGRSCDIRQFMATDHDTYRNSV